VDAETLVPQENVAEPQHQRHHIINTRSHYLAFSAFECSDLPFENR
jgi:hypothetical protein